MDLIPIGHVRSPVKEPKRGGFDEIVSEVVLEEDLVEGLAGLDEFSHVEIIFFMHLPDDSVRENRTRLRIRPERMEELPEVGLFSTRSPHRPNRLGLSLVEIVSIEGNVIKVKGLDALDGSPVLDIKAPSRSNAVKYENMRFAEWTERLMKMRAEGRF